ncbi:hypothetical protein [Mycobacterium kyorinense]|uniref:Uncharacterized protein n=1 Tax=Mycobacterium kyorinense TaxID=487514 RepID=A0A1X1XQZ3_9MYCO|nr:hypothetical protein [Mycobacterium kyorinense]ORW01210.1 hypothetical protein AWC14_08835 [Mycobacterium kyorinense]
MIKTGSRLRSQVCDTQVIVVKATTAFDELRCGGASMVPVDSDGSPLGSPDPAFSGGTVMGKRYTDDSGGELLVTKAGAGTLSVGEIPLTLKEAKPLPASD